MGGHHAHSTSPQTQRMQWMARLLLVPLALVTVVGLVWLWPGSLDRELPDQPREASAAVVAVDAHPCAEEEGPADETCGTAALTFDPVLEGVPADVDVLYPSGPGAPSIEVGDVVTVMEMDGPEGASTWHVVDHERGSALIWVALAFSLAVVAFGRWRGVRSLLGLGLTFVVLVFFFVPAVLAGTSPVLAALVASAAVVLVVLHLTHGTNLVSTVAVLGTLGALAVTCLLAWWGVELLHLTGVTDDLSTAIDLNHGIDARGVLLAGIMIGSLGVLDDVTVTQSATVHEIARANPDYRVRDLYAAGARVGRAHIASVINTIVLAYAGSSLPLLILILANNDSFSAVLTDQLVAQEIARSAVATIGLVAAVPLTTLLAAWAARGAAEPRPSGRRIAGADEHPSTDHLHDHA